MKTAPKLTLVTALLPVLLAPIAIPGIFNSNRLKDPSQDFGDNPLDQFARWTGEVFPLLMNLYMVNNFAQGAVWASPSRLLAYGLAIPFSIKNGITTSKLIEISREINRLTKRLKLLNPENKQTAEQIKAEIDRLMKEGASLNAQINFFGKAIYTAFLIPSFIALLPFIARFTRHGGGIDRYPIRPTESFHNPHEYFERLKANGKSELNCLFNSLGEIGKLAEPNHAKLDQQRKSERVGASPLGKAYDHVTGGFLPSALQLGNVGLRVMAVGGFGLTVLQSGLSSFNENSPYDPSPPDQPKKEADSSNSLYTLANKILSVCLTLSAIGGLLTGTNKSFIHNNGRKAALAQNLGSILYGVASFINTFMPNWSAAATNSFVFAGSILQWTGNGLGAMHKISLKAA